MKKIIVLILIVINIFYIGIVISSGKIAMYLDKVSGRDFSMKIMDYVDPLEIMLVIVLLITSIIIVYRWKD